MSPVSQRRGLRTKARKESFRLQVLADCDFRHVTANAGINFGDFVSRIDHTQVKAKIERRRLTPASAFPSFIPVLRRGQLPENVSKTSSRLIRNKPARYIVAVVAVALAVLFREVLEQKFGALPPYITFSPAVIVAVLLGDMWAGLLASVLSVLAADYLALPPRGHFAIANPADVVSLAVFFISGASICVITELFHRNRQKLAAYQLEKAVEAERSKAEEVRKVAEAASAERQRFYDVLETVPQMISLLTPDHRMVFANHGSREKFGEADGRRCYEARFGRTEPRSEEHT